MIDWKERTVCYADGKQWYFDDVGHPLKLRGFSASSCCGYDFAVNQIDFHLNEPREGYYIPKSELDAEEKYNQAIEEFGLLGHEFGEGALNHYPDLDKYGNLTICHDGIYCTELTPEWCKVKLTFDQLMAIGELKRKMNERENEFIESRELDVEMIKKVAGSGGCGGASAFGFLNASELPNSSKPKSKEAYRILESMGIEWDNVEGKWFKKEWL